MKHPCIENITSVDQVIPKDVKSVSFRGVILDMYRQNPSFSLGSVKRADNWECVLLSPDEIVENGITDVKWLQRNSYLVQSTPGLSQNIQGVIRVHLYSKIEVQLNQEFVFSGHLYQNDDEDTWEHLDLLNMHVFSIEPVKSSDLDLAILEMASLDFKDTRSDILCKLSNLIGDPVVSEYMMLFAMRQGIPNVTQITPIHLSFVNAPELFMDSSELYFTHLFNSFLAQVCEKTGVVQLSESILNENILFPGESESETMEANQIFFAHNTHVLFDEPTELKTGLSEVAMINARAFQELMNSGRNTFHCAHGLVYATCPLLIASVSKNKSMLRKLVEFLEINLKSTESHLNEAYQNATDFSGQFTDVEASYFYKARQCACWNEDEEKLEMLPEVQEYVQSYYTAVRQNGINDSDHQFGIQDLHQILLTARLMCRSFHTSTMTVDIMQRTVTLNEERIKQSK